MAFPAVTSIQDCANFSIVVKPFVPQLFNLPSQLLDAVATDMDGSIFTRLVNLYVGTNPLVSSFAASLAIAAVVLVVSEVNQNFSQIDRLWSILPNLYVMHYSIWARVAGLPHERIDLAAFATTLWSV